MFRGNTVVRIFARSLLSRSSGLWLVIRSRLKAKSISLKYRIDRGLKPRKPRLDPWLDLER